jgi:hypothetical protein
MQISQGEKDPRVAKVIATATMTRLELQRLERAAVAARILPQSATLLGKGGVAYVFAGCELPQPLTCPVWLVKQHSWRQDKAGCSTDDT